MAYGVIFGLLVIAGLGVPISEDIPVIGAGYLIWNGTVVAPVMFAVIFVGVVIGDSFLYVLGRRLGGRWIERRAIANPRFGRMQGNFQAYGDKAVFVARFLPGFRAPTFLLAGAMKVSYVRFVGWDGSAACISLPLWMTLGYYLGVWFGTEIQSMVGTIRSVQSQVGMAALIVALVAALAGGIWFLLKKKRPA